MPSPKTDDFIGGLGAARQLLRATAPRNEYSDHPHVRAAAFSLAEDFTLISPC